MTECFLCGNDQGHHLGCMVALVPSLAEDAAREAGLLPPAPRPSGAPEPVVEVLREGTMTTVPEEEIPAKGGGTVEQCEHDDCENPKYSASARAKYCAEHRDPKNRKE